MNTARIKKYVNYIKSIFGHLRNIVVHKYWVYHYGRMLGLGRWQLLMHDISKLSPTEFFESVKYYQGISSPIPVCKSINGYSKSWQHHKGRNPHHYEYWTDNYDSGMTLIPMPWKYMVEMMADWLAAGRTYQGKNFTFGGQCDWWKSKKNENPSIHPQTMQVIDNFFWGCISQESAFNWWRDYREAIKTTYEQNTTNNTVVKKQVNL